jgi:predicted transcriptional regulator
MPKLSKATKTKAIELLSSGKSQLDTAHALGLTPKCVCNWVADEEFSKELDIAIERNSEALRTKIRTSMETAYNALMDIVQNGANENARVRAAVAVLTAGGYLHEKPGEKMGDVVIKLGTKDASTVVITPTEQLQPISPGQKLPMPNPDPEDKPPIKDAKFIIRQDGSR